MQIVISLLSIASIAWALDNGVALSPPMGWSTWNTLKCNFDHDTLVEIGDIMVKSGMRDAGYTLLNIDDCWPKNPHKAAGGKCNAQCRENARDSEGNIIPDPHKFPQGIRALSDTLSSRGLGLGIYTAHGNQTCLGYPGSLGHEAQDAKAYADWNISFVKNDWCWRTEMRVEPHYQAFTAMRDALNATGHPFIYSIHWNDFPPSGPAPGSCKNGTNCPEPELCNMWRIANDVHADWPSILRLIDADTGFSEASGSGSWNDADMMEVGNGMSFHQDQAHFTMWCMFNSPLVAGNDLRKMSNQTIKILTNKHAIAVNQDKLSVQARLIMNSTTGMQAWVKPLAAPSESLALAFLNREKTNGELTVKFSDFKLPFPAAQQYEVLDLWDDATSLGVKTGSIAASAQGTSALLYKLVPVKH